MKTDHQHVFLCAVDYTPGEKALPTISVSPQERLLVIEGANDLGKGFAEGRERT